jgi:VWFA-related protein
MYVNLARVPATVTGRDGNFVKGLQKQDFQLLDNGLSREIQYLWQETDLPLTIGLIADVSGSESSFISEHRRDMSQFLTQVLGPNDQAFLVAVAVEPWLVTDLTGSIPELRKGVERISRKTPGPVLGEPCPEQLVRVPLIPRGITRPGCGGTALWNAVYAAARLKMKDATGRKALIVLSDGMDTGSTHSLSDAIEAAQSAETIVYTLHSFDVFMAIIPPAAKLMLEGNRNLTRLAGETGGKPFPSPSSGVKKIFAQIESELRSLYVVGFTPPGDAQDGAFHKLELKTAQKGITVRARKGYIASARSGDPGGK